MLDDLIEALYSKQGQIAVIIDEFDAPVTDVLSKGTEIGSYIRDAFSTFYANIKKNTARIRFCFITGVTRLSNMSIFSKMNNLLDISMSPEFADAFGYMEAELIGYFGKGMDEYMEANPGKYSSRDEMAGRIREYYDGYRFSPYSDTAVYNPVSIGRFFNSGCRFENYWDQTGVSTLAVSLAREHDLITLVDEEPAVGMGAFTSFDISQLQDAGLSRDSVLALLYYTGYLTILEGDEDGLVLRFPNKEVSSSFTRSLASRYTDAVSGSIMYEGSRALSENDLHAFLSAADRHISAFPYQFFERGCERAFHLIFHSFLVALGGAAHGEDAGRRGRADDVYERGGRVYVFELKADGDADDAIRQIREKGYADKYRKEGRQIILIGVSFSTEKRKIESWKMEMLQN